MTEKIEKKEIKEVAKPKVEEKSSKPKAVKEVATNEELAVTVGESPVIEKVEEKKIDIKDTFRVGDTVKVFYKIIEGGKERVQPFEGTVISKRGEGISKTFIVRRVGMGGVGVERIFPLYSPKISQLEVLRKGKTRRAKLFYLRKALSKKDARIKERV